MNARMIYAPGALEDLEAIRLYTLETWGIEQARAYIAEMQSCCLSIASGDAVVTAVNAKGHAYGMMRCRSHRIFFSKAIDTEILAILHDRMDLIRHLEDRL